MVLGEAVTCERALQVYLLGMTDFSAALRLQQRWVFEARDDECARLLLCEHPPLITVGRHGSHAHFRVDEYEQKFRPTPVLWLNRGAGCWLQTPGQLAIYPVFPLQKAGLSLGDFYSGLQRSLQETLQEFGLNSKSVAGSSELWVNGRPIASIGLAVRDWVTYHGAVVNINPLLSEFRDVRTGKDHPPMTSLQRECRRPVRSALVRELLVEKLTNHFGFARTALFTEHPQLVRKVIKHALTSVG
jgi:lipoyl(octanoyl) transferase